MENRLPVTNASFSKSDRRSKPKTIHNNYKSSLLLGFLSCLAWLYVAGRLWQDAQNRTLLAGLLKKNSGQRSKVLTMEDKLMVLGCNPNRGDSLDRSVDEENIVKKDLMILDRHEEAQEELPKKVKFFFSTAVQMWDADFYVKVDDNVDLNFDGLIELLQSHRDKESAYIGCMKSGEVVVKEGRAWYEPEWWKFGDQKSDTSGMQLLLSLFVLSKDLAQYVNINSASLKAYAHDDVSVGSWMMGLKATYIDDSHLCCSYSGQDKVCISA